MRAISVMALHLCVILCFALLQTGNSIAAPLSVVDDADRVVNLDQPAQRIISLSPHVTELLYAAGAGNHIVGVAEFSDFPEPAKNLPRIGAHNAFDLEAILALKPDLVIAWESATPKALLARLQGLSIAVFYSEPRLLEDVASNLQRLGRLAGTEVIANRASAAFRQQLAGLRAQYGNHEPVSVFYQIWHQPLMTINGEHIISQVIELCGGRNVFHDLPVLAPRISLESVLIKDPEVIVAGSSADHHADWKAEWSRWPQLQAVQKGHLFYIHPDILQRNTPRILQGADLLCRQLAQVRAARKSGH